MPEALSVPTAFRHAGSSHVSSQKISHTISSRVTISSRIDISSGLDVNGVKLSNAVNDSDVNSGAVHSIALSEAGDSEQNLDPLLRPLLTLHRLGAGDPARDHMMNTTPAITAENGKCRIQWCEPKTACV